MVFLFRGISNDQPNCIYCCYDHSKLAMITLIVLTWIFLFFPFTLDWSTYITLVIVRIPFTIVWWLLIMLGIYIDIKR